MTGVRWFERKRQPVHVAAAVAGGAGEQAIHGGSEPCHREPFAEAGRTAFRPVYPDAAAARVGAFRICGEPYGFTILQQAGPHAEASIAAIADHVAQGSAAQAAPWGKQGKRFENIGLSRTVFAHEQIELRGIAQFGRTVVAKVGQGDAIERHEVSVR